MQSNKEKLFCWQIMKHTDKKYDWNWTIYLKVLMRRIIFLVYFLDCNAKSMHINSLLTFYFFGRIFVALFHAGIIHWRHRMQIK